MYSFPDFSSAKVERSSSEPIGDKALLPTDIAPIESTVACFIRLSVLISPTTVGRDAPPIFESLEDNPFHLPIPRAPRPLPLALLPPPPAPLARAFLRREESRRKNEKPMMTTTRTKPPTTPPAMAPATLLLSSVVAAPIGTAAVVELAGEDVDDMGEDENGIDVEEPLVGVVEEVTAPRQERSVPL